jgi:hypothetical protein
MPAAVLKVPGREFLCQKTQPDEPIFHTCQEGKKCYEESHRYPLAVLLWWWQ